MCAARTSGKTRSRSSRGVTRFDVLPDGSVENSQAHVRRGADGARVNARGYPYGEGGQRYRCPLWVRRLLPNLMRAEEITNGRVGPQALCLCESTMATAWDGEQFVGNPDLVERLVKAGGVRVGNDRVSVAVYSQNRRKSWPHICQR